MKKRLFFFVAILFFMAALVKSNAQQVLSDFYRHYYAIQTSDANCTWARHLSKYQVLYGNNQPYSGAENQKWLVMPTFPGSDECIIASKYDGESLKQFAGGTMVLSRDYSKKIQFFKLVPVAGTSYYTIRNSADPQRALTVNTGFDFFLNRIINEKNPIFFDRAADNARQEFLFYKDNGFTHPLASYKARNSTPPPRPSAPASLQGENLCIDCNETFVAETIVPFPMVNNDLSRREQANEYPYYRLEYSRLWKLLRSSTFPAGYQLEAAFGQRVGMTATGIKEVSEKLNISISANSEISFKANDVGAKLAESLARMFGKPTKLVSTHEENISKPIEITQFTSVAKTTLIADYQLVERYRLYRPDGTKILEWDVYLTPEFNTRVSYVEGELGGRLDTGSSLVVQEQGYASKDSYKINLIQKNAPDDAYFVDRVYPNPSNSGLTISLNIPEAASVTACFYDLTGRKIREVREDMAPAISNSLLKIDEAKVPKGMYLLKVDIVSIANPARKYSYKQKVVLH